MLTDSFVLRVLVVDDDVILTRAIARALSDCDITIEYDGEAAIESLRRADHGVPYDVVLCDSTLPGARGCDVAAAASELSAPPLFIAMSGADDGLAWSHIVLLKPFSRSEVHEAVHHLAEHRGDFDTTSLAHQLV